MNMLQTLSSRIPGGARGLAAIVALFAAISIAASLGIVALMRRSQPPGPAEEVPESAPAVPQPAEEVQAPKTSEVFDLCMAQADAFAKAYRDDEAINRFGLAIDNAPDAESKALAGLELGWLLLGKAESPADPYALSARQYLDVVVTLTKDKDRLRRAYQGVAQCSRLQGDVEGAYAAIKALIELAPNETDAAEWRLGYLDACVNLGTWPDMSRLLDEMKPFLASAKWNVRYQVLQFAALEQLLRKESWFDEYQRQYPDAERVKLRAALLSRAEEQCQATAATAPAETRDELHLRMALLSFEEGQYALAKQYAELFLEGNPATGRADALLLLTRLSLVDGDVDGAMKAITVYLKRFSFDSKAERDVAAVIQGLEKAGRNEEAYRFVQELLDIPVQWDTWPAFILKAACLANRLGRNDDVMRYHTMLVESCPGDRALSDAALALANVSIERNDLVGADKWLVEYLTQHMDRAQTDKLFTLFDIRRKLQVPLCELVLVERLASGMDPSNSAALSAKVAIASRMEEMGLTQAAEAQYSESAMLNYVAAEQSLTGAVMTVVHEATLGKARCLLNDGDVLKSDHLLREICRVSKPGPVRSEAAYWWATIARSMGQCKEASRRLGLINPAHLTVELAAGVECEKNLVELTAGRTPVASMDDLFGRLTKVVSPDRLDSLKRAYRSYFDELEKQQAVDGMQSLLANAMKNPYAKDLPLRSMALRLAHVVLKKKDLIAFVDCLSKYEELIKTDGKTDVLDSARALLGASKHLEQLKPDILKHL